MDRSKPYRASDWILDGVESVAALYVDDVCSGEEAALKWPDSVAMSLAALPEGTRVEDTRVIKPGHTIDKKSRVADIRSDMRHAFGDQTDVRIIALARCPGATRTDLEPLERGILAEIARYRLSGIKVKATEPSELFLVTPEISRDVVAKISVAGAKCMIAMSSALQASTEQAIEQAREAESRAFSARHEAHTATLILAERERRIDDLERRMDGVRGILQEIQGPPDTARKLMMIALA